MTFVQCKDHCLLVFQTKQSMNFLKQQPRDVFIFPSKLFENHIATFAQEMEPEMPTVPPHLEAIRVLKGGFNEPVTLAWHQETDHLVVVKFFNGSNEFVNKVEEPHMFIFYKTGLPNHENVISVLQCISPRLPNEGPWYKVVFTYCNAGSLFDLYAHVKYENRLLPEKFIRQIIEEVLSGLRACDENAFAHCDMHLGNILLHHRKGANDIEAPHAVICDFGDQRYDNGLGFQQELKRDTMRFFVAIRTIMTCLDCPPIFKSKEHYSEALLDSVELCAGLNPFQLTPDLQRAAEIFCGVAISAYQNEKQCVEFEQLQDQWLVKYFRCVRHLDEQAVAALRQLGSDPKKADTPTESGQSYARQHVRGPRDLPYRPKLTGDHCVPNGKHSEAKSPPKKIWLIDDMLQNLSAVPTEDLVSALENHFGISSPRLPKRLLQIRDAARKELAELRALQFRSPYTNDNLPLDMWLTNVMGEMMKRYEQLQKDEDDNFDPLAFKLLETRNRKFWE